MSLHPYDEQPMSVECHYCGGSTDGATEVAELVVGGEPDDAGDLLYGTGQHVLVHVDCMAEGDRERLA